MTAVDEFKTSCRIVGERQVDEFRALCSLFGRRPHQLVADWVLAEIQHQRKDPDVAKYLDHMLAAMREHRSYERLIERGDVIDLSSRRRLP